MNPQLILDQIKQLIGSAQVQKAITQALTLSQNYPPLDSFQIELFQIKGRWETLNKDARMGILSRADQTQLNNQITHDLLQVINNMEQHPTTNNNTQHPANIQNSKNVNTGTINAGGNVIIGDQHVHTTGTEQPLQPKHHEPIRIALVSANPLDTNPLRLEKEARLIDQELRGGKLRNQFDIKKYAETRWDDLVNLLLDNTPDFLHFSGHGLPEGIALTNDKTEMTHLVPTVAVAGLLKLFEGKIKCVFFNSCYSSHQGREVVQHVPHVIGMKAAVPDDTAIQFAVSFYKAIFAGKDVGFAFSLAQNAIAAYQLQGINLPEHLHQ